MYEQFGFTEWDDGRLGLKLFVPDNGIDPAQYQRGGRPKISAVRVVGTFQTLIDPSAANWDASTGLQMTHEDHANGLLFTYALPEGFPDGYYQYKYVVTFENGSVRWVGDPCTRYGGDEQDNSAFVVGGNPVVVTPLDPARRRGPQDLALYELMIHDFTDGYHGSRAQVDAVSDKVQYLLDLGVNAVEFMPWIAWPDSDSFSWGYDPSFFFSVESAYTFDPTGPLDKLMRLARMISAFHEEGLMVVLDIVLQHASAGVGTRGFPYYWLWQEPNQSPFIGNFTNQETFGSLPLDYHNDCTLQFIVDVCNYWVDRLGVDGFRFDQISGYHNPDFPARGAPALVSALKAHYSANGNPGIPLILEDTWDYEVIGDTNQIGATHGWFDMFRSRPAGALKYGGRLQPEYIRVLNAARDFNFPAGPLIYVENHDHSTITNCAGGRDNWFRTQPYAIALATCSGAVMITNGQEFGRSEYLLEPGQDNNVPPEQHRVNPRPLRWTEADDAIGQQMRGLYAFLLGIRRDHTGLRSPNFYPNDYDWGCTRFNSDGYGIDVDRQIVIYHRWGTTADGGLERFIIAVNFSSEMQFVDIPFPANGEWHDLLNGNRVVQVDHYRLFSFGLNSNWGCVFFKIG